MFSCSRGYYIFELRLNLLLLCLARQRLSPGESIIIISDKIDQEIGTFHLTHTQLALFFVFCFFLIRYRKECHLRPDSNASGCLPNDVSGPVLPKVVEHYGKCASLLASLCSDEGVVRGRIRWGTSGL